MRKHLQEGNLSKSRRRDSFILVFQPSFFERDKSTCPLVPCFVHFTVGPLPNLFQLFIPIHCCGRVRARGASEQAGTSLISQSWQIFDLMLIILPESCVIQARMIVLPTDYTTLLPCPFDCPSNWTLADLHGLCSKCLRAHRKDATESHHHYHCQR